MPDDAPTAKASGGMSPTIRPAPSSRSDRVSLAARVTRSLWNDAGAADAVGLVERQPVHLHDAGVALERAVGHLALDRQVEEPARRGGPDADAGFGRLARMALMTSMDRDACPNP